MINCYRLAILHFRGLLWYNNSVMKKILLVLIGGIFTLTTFATDENPAADYVVIAPKNYVDLWTWYIGERAKAHPEIKFAVKSAEAIYSEYPYDAANTDGSPRNAAESIHAYIGVQKGKGTKYFILGGNWFDAQYDAASGSGQAPRQFKDGSSPSLDNAIPGIVTYPRVEKKNGFAMTVNPSDLYFACHYIPEGAKYAWDPNGDGVYCGLKEVNPDNMCDYRHFQPEVVVARMDFTPGYWQEDGKDLNYSQLVTKYVDKLARGEAKDFAGNDKYAVWISYCKGYDEKGDPDVTGVMHERGKAIEQYRKAAEVEYYTYTKAVENDETEAKRMIADVVAKNWDVFLPFGHGTPDGFAGFDTYDFKDSTVIMKFFMANVPCFTGSTTSETSGAQVALSNPNGGSLVSVNNTSFGWASSSGIKERYLGVSDELVDWCLDAYVKDGETAGEAWRKAIATYSPRVFTPETTAAEIAKRDHTGNEDCVYAAIVEEMLFGDPLIKLSPLHIAPRIIVK